MLEEHVDLVAGDFNGAAWRRPCGNDRKPTSIIEEAFADADLPMPPGTHHCGSQVQCQENGQMYAGFSSHWTSKKSGKYDYTVRFLFSTGRWVFAQKIKSVTMKYGCILHLLTLAGTLHRGIYMISACTSKKDPLRTNATKEEAGHKENKATQRNRRNHPYEHLCPSISTIRKTCTTMVRQGPRSMT